MPGSRGKIFLATMLLASVVASLALSASASAAVPWQRFLRAPGGGRVNDIAGPNAKGQLTISSGIHLWHVGRNHRAVKFIKPHAPNGRIGYLPAYPNIEPYIVQIPTTHCPGFRTDDIWGFTGPRYRLIQVTAAGIVKRTISLPSGLVPSGIAFDTVGLFNNRLLVMVMDYSTKQDSLLAICPGQAPIWIGTGLPKVEGGLSVAPIGFGPGGSFGGWLIATNETDNQVWAISPTGAAQPLITLTGIPRGGDIGVESTGFVPQGLDAQSAAYMSDRFTEGNRQRGNGMLMTLSWPTLQGLGVQPGDLLVAGEGGGPTVDVNCLLTCTANLVAYGPASGHIEGHIVFAHQLANVR